MCVCVMCVMRVCVCDACVVCVCVCVCGVCVCVCGVCEMWCGVRCVCVWTPNTSFAFYSCIFNGRKQVTEIYVLKKEWSV